MSEHIAVESGTDRKSKPSKGSCCRITDCRGRLHRGIEHRTDCRFNVGSKHNAGSEHYAWNDDAWHGSTRNNESEHNSRHGRTDAWDGNSDSGNGDARDYTESDISPDNADITNSGDDSNITNAGNHTDITGSGIHSW